MFRLALFVLLVGFGAAVRCQAVDMLVYPDEGIFKLGRGNGNSNGNGRVGGPGGAMLASLQAASGLRLDLQVTQIAHAHPLAGGAPQPR